VGFFIFRYFQRSNHATIARKKRIMPILVIKVINTKFRIMASQARIESFVKALLNSHCNLSVVANVLAVSLFDLQKRVSSLDLELSLVDLEYLINISSYWTNREIAKYGDLDGDCVWNLFDFEVSIEA